MKAELHARTSKFALVFEAYLANNISPDGNL
jgi:hypothetical protein